MPFFIRAKIHSPPNFIIAHMPMRLGGEHNNWTDPESIFPFSSLIFPFIKSDVGDNFLPTMITNKSMKIACIISH